MFKSTNREEIDEISINFVQGEERYRFLKNVFVQMMMIFDRIFRHIFTPFYFKLSGYAKIIIREFIIILNAKGGNRGQIKT